MTRLLLAGCACACLCKPPWVTPRLLRLPLFLNQPSALSSTHGANSGTATSMVREDWGMVEANGNCGMD